MASLNEPIGPSDAGGVPGGSTRNRHRLANLNLHLHALKRGWDVPPDLKRDTLDRVARLMRDKNASDRTILAGGKLIDAFERTSLAAIDTAIRAEQHTAFDDRLGAVEKRLDEHDSSTQQG